MGHKKCEHGREKYDCKDCGGGGICEHDTLRRTCKLCEGSLICEHGTRRNRCKPCKGSQICEHGVRRSQCKSCGGVEICEHNIQRSQCKHCSDPIHITIMNWIIHSKKSDKNKNRFDETNYIDYDFCKGLIQESGEVCYYCDIKLQYIEYNETLATIERLDNDIGHIKENCVIACRTCNFGKVGQR